MATQNTPLLNLFGLQKMQQGAEGETGQRFYNRDTFKDLSANLAMGLNSMRLNPDASLPQRMQAQIAQRGQNRTRNRTVEALRKKAEGGDKLAAKYLGAIESGALPVAQAMSAYMQEGAQIRAEGRRLAEARAAEDRAEARAAAAAERAANQPLSQIAKLRDDLANKRITQEDFDAQLRKLTYIAPSSANDPQSTLGKLAADLKAGLLSQEEYEAAVKKATYVAPAKDTPAASTVGKIMQDFNAGLISEEDKNNAIAKATKSGGQAFTVTTADGTQVTYGGSGGNSKLTEGQSKDLGFAARIPDELMEQLDKFDFALASYPDKLLDQDPTGLARGAFQNPNFQIAQTLSQQFLTPLIRKDTGAAIQAWETQLYTEMYFPRPGDTQEVIERKRDARRLAVEGLRKGLPPLLRIQVDPEFAKEFARLQNDVLPENSALRSITKDWAAGTQPQGSLPEQAQGSDVQLESGSNDSATDYSSLSNDALADALLNSLPGSKEAGAIANEMASRRMIASD
jgi:hypothetical protein